MAAPLADTGESSAAIPQDEEMTPPTNSLAPPESSTLNVVSPQASALEELPISRPVEDYKLPKCTMPPQSQLQPIETFVMNAFQSQQEASPDPSHIQGYRAIADALRRTTDPPMLHLVFIALRTASNGRLLHQWTSSPSQHAQLTHLVFRFDSTTPPQALFHEVGEEKAEALCKVYRDSSLLDAHLHLILALVSARSIHLVPALTVVWKMLADRTAPLTEEMSNRLHAMLYTMMNLIPKARTELFPIIAARFPFWKRQIHVLTWYALQAFRVLDYLPSMRKNVLELVIDKCLEIDVNIKIKLNGEVLVEEEKEDEDVSKELDPKKNTETESKGDDVDELSDKLDAMLAMLLETIRQGATDGANVRLLYYEILPVFESTILTTHKSKFVQFCIFLLCGLESNLIVDATDAAMGQESEHHAILHRDFAAKLLEIIVDPYRATLTRQSGACYLASFISRASFVGPETVCESISALLRWAEAYIETLGTDAVRAADAREQSDLHSLFYTICQAAFYIMCFRGGNAIKFYKDAVEGRASTNSGGEDEELLPDPEHIDLSSRRWTNVCNHELQPLRFCLESVRSEFLHVAHAFDLIDESILDRLVVDAKKLSTGRVNKRAASTISTAATLEKQRQTGGVGGLGRGSNPLKSFFPFDPLLLRRSHGFTESFYKHWQGPVEEEDILIIDDAPEGDDQIFDMDEDLVASDDEEGQGDDSDDDADPETPVVVSDTENKDGDDESDNDEVPTTPDTFQKKEMQRMAWTETMKRPRSQSMENGSW